MVTSDVEPRAPLGGTTSGSLERGDPRDGLAEDQRVDLIRLSGD